jgi:MFS family permease
MSSTGDVGVELPAATIASPIDTHEPVKKVSVLFQILYFLTNVSTNALLLPSIILLIPAQINVLDPAHHVTSLGIVESIGGLFSFIATPLTGALSDRSTSRLGRRRFWMLISMIFAAVAVLLLAKSPTVLVLLIGWALLQFFGNALLTLFQALIPDQVPVHQRGTVSASFGLAIPFSIMIGGMLVGMAFAQTPTTTYYVFLIAFIVLALVFVVFMKDRVQTKEAREPFQFKRFLAGFWINPRKHPDFAWALFTRLLLFLGFYAIDSYLQYYLQDSIHYSRIFPGHPVLEGTTIVESIEFMTILIFSFAAGIVSDKLGRRKPVVIGAAILVALAMLTLLAVPTWTGVEIYGAIMGAGYGSYLAVDTALVTQVLPTSRDRAKDLGIINLSLSIPLIVSPLLAAGVVSSMGYPVLFIIAGLLALLSASFVTRIKMVH